ncbi:hypothetical protein WQ53_10670 [Pseudoxanthomonas suwonensis]|uniref:Uncharacterized protein n=1 Tax=Pseudoxanthomonas suwonensis TaxID=314722 RepID=A0A0E3Z1K2_9GAMM|nr:hypothetical protein WQ53_10670 [Pseudoxanthomonas suwonensis]
MGLSSLQRAREQERFDGLFRQMSHAALEGFELFTGQSTDLRLELHIRRIPVRLDQLAFAVVMLVDFFQSQFEAARPGVVPRAHGID